ncbi:MAG: deoxyguanosinetriphosphate triphosphohydrolase [Acidobacteriota bacterium]|nr:deoxyguanosinetriphosphate triphosphohydrolase [Acidobacteriota bacterium]
MKTWSERRAPWAQEERDSLGRRHPESDHPYRLAYARDRDRIIHCRAFRRLEYKTQVFVNHEGDHYRTRLTHTLEVNQIARTVARALGLNTDLADSLALSHDLGHTPFGHLGEEILGPLMREQGGFNHNRQTLRIVEKLERRYPEFPGLNLTWEVREGIAKHSGQPDLESTPEAAEYQPEQPPPLEAQIIDLVDEIAYNHHDLDDGLESRLLDLPSLVDGVPLFGRPFRAAQSAHPTLDDWMWIKISLRGVIDRLVTDLIESTSECIEALEIRSVDDVRRQAGWIVSLSDRATEGNAALKQFLREKLYRHPRMIETRSFFARVLRELFEAYRDLPGEMPERFAGYVETSTAARAAGDYIAGMTDRFALQEHRRLCGGPGPEGVPFASR